MQRWVGKKLKVSKVSTGRYKITHNIRYTNHCIQAIPVNDTDWNAFVISGKESGDRRAVEWRLVKAYAQSLLEAICTTTKERPAYF